MATFEIKGLNEIIERFLKIPEAVGKRLVKDGLQGAAELIQAEVKQQAPVGPTGTLKDSIVIKPVKSKGGRVGLRVTSNEGSAPGQAPFHSAFVNYGTSKMPANPYFTRAFEAKAEEARDRAINDINELLRKEIES